MPCHADRIKTGAAGEKASVTNLTNDSPQVRCDDIEQWIGGPARQSQQRYLLANDIPATLSLLDDTFRN